MGDWSAPPTVAVWGGQEGIAGGDVIGLLLDLDQGTLTVYINGRKLGVMKDGLTGEYCWGVDSFCGIVKTERGKPAHTQNSYIYLGTPSFGMGPSFCLVFGDTIVGASSICNSCFFFLTECCS